MRVRSSKMRVFSCDCYIFHMKFPTDFTCRKLHGFTWSPCDSMALVIFEYLTVKVGRCRWRVSVMLCCRIGDIGRLMVQRVSDAEPGTFVTAESYPTHSRLALSQHMDLFIGGLPPGYHVRTESDIHCSILNTTIFYSSQARTLRS